MQILNDEADPKMQLQQQQQRQQKIYVQALVGITVRAIAFIWPNSVRENTTEYRPLASLSAFLHHILKHSRTTQSTLQLAVFYLLRVRARIYQRKCDDDVYALCGRRMFLAALICSHKFLQDKSYKSSAWSKLSGLDVHEINRAERVMLQLLDYQLMVRKETYQQWVSMLQSRLEVHPVAGGLKASDMQPISIPTATTPTSPSSLLNFGILTPVESSLASSHANLGLLSPPEEGTMAAKRRHTTELEERKTKRQAF